MMEKTHSGLLEEEESEYMDEDVGDNGRLSDNRKKETQREDKDVLQLQNQCNNSVILLKVRDCLEMI